MMYTSGNTFFSVLALHLSNDAGLKIFYIYHYVGGRKRCALCDAQIDGKVHCHCILEHTYDDVPCKSYNVYIFTRKVRVSRLTKNPNGHLFHIHVIFFFFLFFFWIDFFKALIYKTIISEIHWKDSFSAMSWTK